MVSVEIVADLFEAGCFETVSFVDDRQFGPATGARFLVHVGIDDTMLGIVELRTWSRSVSPALIPTKPTRPCKMLDISSRRAAGMTMR